MLKLQVENKSPSIQQTNTHTRKLEKDERMFVQKKEQIPSAI